MSKRDTLSKMSINDMVKMIDEDKGESNSWTVWVGGSEINSHLLTQSKAISLAMSGLTEVIVMW
jgi:hypothetical protein